jgi:hypothetical protein
MIDNKLLGIGDWGLGIEKIFLNIYFLGRVFKPFLKHLSLWRSPQPPLKRGAFRVSFPPFLRGVRGDLPV